MSVTEHRRNQLYNTLTEKLGAEEADTMVDLLPPVGWADVATKRDLDYVVAQLRLEMAEMREQAHRDLTGVEKRLLIAMISTMLATVIAVSGLAFAAAGLT